MFLVWKELKATKANNFCCLVGCCKCLWLYPTPADLFNSRAIWYTPSMGWVTLRVIFTNCTVSIILILAGMNIILELGIDISVFQSLLSPPAKEFIDDFFPMSPSLQQTHVLLNRAPIVLFWVWMSVKPFMSIKLVFVKGENLNDNALAIKVNKSMRLISPIQSQESLLDF